MQQPSCNYLRNMNQISPLWEILTSWEQLRSGGCWLHNIRKTTLPNYFLIYDLHSSLYLSCCYIFSSQVSIFFFLLFSTNDVPHILKKTSKGSLLGSKYLVHRYQKAWLLIPILHSSWLSYDSKQSVILFLNLTAYSHVIITKFIALKYLIIPKNQQ